MALSKCSVVSRSDPGSVDPVDLDISLKESVFHGTSAFPCAVYDDDLTKEEVLWHWHEEFELGVITKGRVLSFSGARGYELEEGDFFFVNSGVMHAVRNAQPGQPCSLCSIVFHGSLIGGAPGSVFDEAYVQPILQATSFPECMLRREESCEERALLMEAWTAVQQEKEEYPLIVRNALSKIFVQLKKRCVKEEHVDLVKEQRVQRMLAVIHGRYAESLSLKDIADAAHVSPNEALRCFKEVLHISPIQYLKNHRLQKAAQMLRESDLSVSVVSDQCGFEDRSYFGKEFRKLVGCTPSGYRKMERSRT